MKLICVRDKAQGFQVFDFPRDSKHDLFPWLGNFVLKDSATNCGEYHVNDRWSLNLYILIYIYIIIIIYVGYTVHNFPHSHLTFQVGEKIVKITHICVYMYYKYVQYIYIYYIHMSDRGCGKFFLAVPFLNNLRVNQWTFWMVKDWNKIV